jgi:hypothetical protein
MGISGQPIDTCQSPIMQTKSERDFERERPIRISPYIIKPTDVPDDNDSENKWLDIKPRIRNAEVVSSILIGSTNYCWNSGVISLQGCSWNGTSDRYMTS